MGNLLLELFHLPFPKICLLHPCSYIYLVSRQSGDPNTLERYEWALDPRL